MEYKIKIDKILFTDKLFTIISNNKIFISKIVKGSVTFKIYNEDGNEVNLDSINENDNIIVYGLENKENIIIKKIYVKNNYRFFLDSDSDSEKIFDFM